MTGKQFLLSKYQHLKDDGLTTTTFTLDDIGKDMELYSQQVAKEKASLAFDAGEAFNRYQDIGLMDKQSFLKLHFPNQ